MDENKTQVKLQFRKLALEHVILIYFSVNKNHGGTRVCNFMNFLQLIMLFLQLCSLFLHRLE